MSWWEKKSAPVTKRSVEPVTPAKSLMETPMPEMTPKGTAPHSREPNRTILGPSVTLRGELAGEEDLYIEGQFEGSIHLRDHCLTVGAQGQVKAEIQVSRAVIQGAVTGNIIARERIEILKTGRVLGDLVAPGIAIEDGAYFKGSIEILREDVRQPVATSDSIKQEETHAQ